MIVLGPARVWIDGVYLGETTTPVAPSRVVFDQELEEQREDNDADYFTGWFCIRTAPFQCPAEGCDFIAYYQTAAHLILVWQELDDPNLLKHAARARDVGRNPRVTGYRSEFGLSASYYAWIAAGRPVHGVKQAT